MLVLSAADVRRALDMPAAIDAMRRAFAALAAGRAVVPPRVHLDVAPHDAVSLCMPAFVRAGEGEDEALTVKVVSLYPGNPERGLARIQGSVLVLEPATGRALGLLDGGALTAIRTGAASGLATDLLARRDSRTVAIFGAGVQARTQLEAVCCVRDIGRGWIHAPTAAHAQALVAEVAGRGPIPDDLRVAASPREALAEADVVCTATTSASPVFADEDLRPGTHVNAVGSFQPHVAEIPPETVVRARVVVDSREAALSETGDLIQPLEAGRIRADHVVAELGELLTSGRAVRRSAEDVTLFESVGLAVQDAVAASTALARYSASPSA